MTRVPPEGGTKPMQGFSDRRLRLGVIYRIDQPEAQPDAKQSQEPGQDEERKQEPVLWIIDIGARGDIYK